MKSLGLVLVPAIVLSLVACEKTPPSAGQGEGPKVQRFEVKGILLAIGFANQEVTVEHEEIPDYMPAMTMPFSVKNMREVEALSTGDGIQFEFVVTEDDSWIENVRKIDAALVKLPPRDAPAGAVSSADRVKEGQPLPAFELIDDQGRAVSSAEYNGKVLLLTFIFTRCPVPNFCPLMSSNFAEIEAATAGDEKLRGVQLLSVSFDPEFDTPEVLKDYAGRFRKGDADRWRFATGTAEQVQRLSAGFALNVRAGEGTIDHGLATVLIDREGVVQRIWRGNGWKAEEVLSELRKL